MKKFLISTVMVVLTIVFGCQKGDNGISNDSPQNSSVNGPFTGSRGSSSNELDSNCCGDTISLSTNKSIAAKSILDAKIACEIPMRRYSSSLTYKNKYLHLTQDEGECSWTSYVLCAAAIANGDMGAYVYPVDHDQVLAVKDWCGDAYIDRLHEYAVEKDRVYFSQAVLCKESKSTKGRFAMLKNMLNHLYLYQEPFVAIITSGGIGHYVVVWDIDWRRTEGKSSVYFTDPLDDPKGTLKSQLKSMKLTTFLNFMGPQNPDVNNYCALFLR